MRIRVTALSAGIYEARLGGRLLCRAREPFLEAARVLAAEGVDPAERIEMWREGDAHPSMTARLGAAARLTVRETERDGPRFVPYRPFDGHALSRRDGAAPAAERGSAGAQVAAE